MSSTPKMLLTDLVSLTTLDGHFVMVIHDGNGGRQITVSDFLEFVKQTLNTEGSYGGSAPSNTPPADPISGVTAWVDTTNPTKPVMKIYINGNWVDITNTSAGDMKASIYDTNGEATDIFAFADSEIATRVHGIPSSTMTNLRNHLDATDKHVTSADRVNWAAAVTHVSDTDKHMSATEKQNWEAAATHMNDATIHVNATLKAKWNGMVDLSDLNQAIEDIQNGGAGSGEGAGGHNCIYRGQKLGESVTAAQWAAIASGDFTDMFIGDYWEIGGIKYRIAAFDYYLHTGDTECTKHHVVIVPDSKIGSNKAMQGSGGTSKGYGLCDMFTTNLNDAKTTIQTAFGATHILTHRKYFTNAASNGIATGGSWYDANIDIMSEINVYGSRIMGSEPDDANTVQNLYSTDKSQYPLFRFRHDLIVEASRGYYWLRDIVSGAHFAFVNADGICSYYGAYGTFGVRPAFSLIGD